MFKWFHKKNKHCQMLIGAIAGDIIGSDYEFHPIRRTDFLYSQPLVSIQMIP